MSNEVQLSESMVDGMRAGCLATVPMTAVMGLLHRELPAQPRYPLPPQQIMKDLAGERSLIPQAAHFDWATWAAHFAFGTGAGAVYGAVAQRRSIPPLTSGVAFGLAVWVSHYALGFPALQFRSAATQEPWKRNALMIAAHVVWGGTLGTLHLRKRSDAIRRTISAADEMTPANEPAERAKDLPVVQSRRQH